MPLSSRCPRRPRAVAGLLLLLAPAAASPALERQVEVAPGERLRVFEEGRGEPVVLIPGPMGSAFGFRKLIGPLVARNRSLGVSDAEIEVLAQGLGSFSIDRVANAGFFVFEEEPQAVVAAVERALTSGRLGGPVSAGHGVR